MTATESAPGAPQSEEPRVKVRGAATTIRFPFVSMVVLGLVVLVAVFAPLIAPHDPEVGQLSNKLIPPVWQEGGNSDFLLGTDTLGRDIFTRILYGARVSLMVAILATGLAGVLGTIVGLVAGFYRGWVEIILMRITDMTLALPLMLMAIVLVALLGASLTNVLMVIVILLWPYYARQIRGEALAISEEDFIDLARVAGLSSPRILWRHILPNVITQPITYAMSDIVVIIVGVVTLSYLGLGVPPPTPDWGSMISSGQSYLTTQWQLSTIPGIAVVIVGLSFSLIGDGLTHRLRPE